MPLASFTVTSENNQSSFLKNKNKTKQLLIKTSHPLSCIRPKKQTNQTKTTKTLAVREKKLKTQKRHYILNICSYETPLKGIRKTSPKRNEGELV